MSNSRNWTDAQKRYHEGWASLRAAHPNHLRALLDIGPFRTTIRIWHKGKIISKGKVPPGAYHMRTLRWDYKGPYHAIHHLEIFL